MHDTRSFCRSLAALSVAAALTLPAQGQGQIFRYFPGDTLTAKGLLEAKVDVFGMFTNSQTVDFASSSTVNNQTTATISASKNFSVSALGNMNDVNCQNYGEAHVMNGNTTYDFQGQANQMTLTIATLRDHDNLIDRVANEMYTLDPKSVESTETLPKSPGKRLVIDVPFVAQNDPSYLQLTPGDFCLNRSDSGNTAGSTKIQWKIYFDADNSGTVSPLDNVVYTSQITLGAVPGSSSSKCNPGQLITLPRHRHMLRFIYETSSDLKTDSPGCPFNIADFSSVVDDVFWRITVI